MTRFFYFYQDMCPCDLAFFGIGYYLGHLCFSNTSRGISFFFGIDLILHSSYDRVSNLKHWHRFPRASPDPDLAVPRTSSDPDPAVPRTSFDPDPAVPRTSSDPEATWPILVLEGKVNKNKR